MNKLFKQLILISLVTLISCSDDAEIKDGIELLIENGTSETIIIKEVSDDGFQYEILTVQSYRATTYTIEKNTELTARGETSHMNFGFFTVTEENDHWKIY